MKAYTVKIKIDKKIVHTQIVNAISRKSAILKVENDTNHLTKENREYKVFLNKPNQL